MVCLLLVQAYTCSKRLSSSIQYGITIQDEAIGACMTSQLRSAGLPGRISPCVTGSKGTVVTRSGPHV